MRIVLPCVASATLLLSGCADVLDIATDQLVSSAVDVAVDSAFESDEGRPSPSSPTTGTKSARRQELVDAGYEIGYEESAVYSMLTKTEIGDASKRVWESTLNREQSIESSGLKEWLISRARSMAAANSGLLVLQIQRRNQVEHIQMTRKLFDPRFPLDQSEAEEFGEMYINAHFNGFLSGIEGWQGYEKHEAFRQICRLQLIAMLPCYEQKTGDESLRAEVRDVLGPQYAELFPDDI